MKRKAKQLRRLLDRAPPPAGWPDLSENSVASALVREMRAAVGFVAEEAFYRAGGSESSNIDIVRVTRALGATHAIQFARLVEEFESSTSEEQDPLIADLLSEASSRGWLSAAPRRRWSLPASDLIADVG